MLASSNGSGYLTFNQEDDGSNPFASTIIYRKVCIMSATNKSYNHIATIFDIYITYEGESYRHVTIADIILKGSFYVSSREQAIKLVLDEVEQLIKNYEHVRVYDTYDMDYYDFYGVVQCDKQ